MRSKVRLWVIGLPLTLTGMILGLVLGCKTTESHYRVGATLDDLLTQYQVKDVVAPGQHADTMLFANYTSGLTIWLRNVMFQENDPAYPHPHDTTLGAVYVFSTRGYLKTIPTDAPWAPSAPTVYPLMIHDKVFLLSYRTAPTENNLFRAKLQVHLITPERCSLVYEANFNSMFKGSKENAIASTHFQILSDMFKQYLLVRLEYEQEYPAKSTVQDGLHVSFKAWSSDVHVWDPSLETFVPIRNSSTQPKKEVLPLPAQRPGELPPYPYTQPQKDVLSPMQRNGN
jgi:hypothetical protein